MPDGICDYHHGALKNQKCSAHEGSDQDKGHLVDRTSQALRTARLALVFKLGVVIQVDIIEVFFRGVAGPWSSHVC